MKEGTLLYGFSSMLAGLGLFMLGMRFLEDALRRLAGRSFKLFLRRQAGNKLKAVAGGAVVTAVLQSGSVVNLMVLAFVGSGVLSLRHALAVILGSNIGTTLDSWVVALVGFRYSIEIITFPLLGLSGLLWALSEKGGKWHQRATLAFGFAAIFAGLDFIKSGFSGAVVNLDFSSLSTFPLFVFIIFGIVLTALIQSSYAVVALVLGSLHAGVLEIIPATAIVLGSELGTTLKLLVAATGGSAAKRQVAWANFFFNAVTILIVGLMLRPLNIFIAHFLYIKDPMVALVAFQSMINVAGALIFLPLLNPVAGFLEKRISEKFESSSFISRVPSSSGDLALDAMEQEIRRFIGLTLWFFQRSFSISKSVAESTLPSGSRQALYVHLKKLHGEIHSYYLALPKEQLDAADVVRADQLVSSLRNAMFAAKSIHDSESDIRQLAESSNEEKFTVYQRARKDIEIFCADIRSIIDEPETGRFAHAVASYKALQEKYGNQLALLYRPGMETRISETEISTLLNFHRELYSGYKAMVWAVKDLLLSPADAAYFSDQPGFIR